MNGFTRRLRQFRETWLAETEQALWAARSIIGFRFNADDTPRGWPEENRFRMRANAASPAPSPPFHELAINDLQPGDTKRRAA